MNMQATGAVQRAAWDAYLALTQGLLGALQAGQEDSAINARLGGVAVRIRYCASLWGEDGQMLVAAADSAARLYRHGDRSAMAAVLHVMARRLFALSAGRCRPGHPGRRHQRWQ